MDGGRLVAGVGRLNSSGDVVRWCLEGVLPVVGMVGHGGAVCAGGPALLKKGLAASLRLVENGASIDRWLRSVSGGRHAPESQL